MSVNHFANQNINPKLDAYVKNIEADTLNFENLTVSDIDVADTTKASLYKTPNNTSVFNISTFETTKQIVSDAVETTNTTLDELIVQNNISCQELQTSVGIWNPTNIYLNNISNILGAKLTNFINCFPDEASAYDAFWKYSTIKHEQTVVNSILRPVTTVRCNVYAKAQGTVPPPSNFFGFTILDPEITVNSQIVSVAGCCQGLFASTSPFYPPVRWMTQIDKTTVGNTSISVNFGDVSPTAQLYPTNQILYFQLEISYVNIPA
jgi:hypothetical protein